MLQAVMEFKAVAAEGIFPGKGSEFIRVWLKWQNSAFYAKTYVRKE